MENEYTYKELKQQLIRMRKDGHCLAFRYVTKIPKGYTIWSVGDNFKDGYLPLCKLIPGTFQIDTTNLLCIKTPNARTILAACGIVGGRKINPELNNMKRYILKHNDVFSERMKVAIPLIEELIAQRMVK